MENLLERAKAFIGLGEGEEIDAGNQQMEISSVIRPRKETKNIETNPYSIFYNEPKIYEDSLNISSDLRRGAPVLINLKHLEPSEGTRLIDFVCGTAYAIDGHMMKIGESIFLFTPNHINIVDAEEKSVLGEEINSFESKKETFFTSR